MTTDLHQRIRQTAAANREASVALLRALIVAGRDGEPAVQARVAEAARASGCAVDTVIYDPADVPMVEEYAGAGAIDQGERQSVLARRKGAGGGRSLIFFAHPDGEPVAGLERWTQDPFAGTVAAGRMYGWGIADDLAGVAIMLEGLRIALASSGHAGGELAGDIILASTPSKRHARGVSALLHGGVTADAAIYLHPAESGAGMGEIKALASGQVEFRITVEGRQPPSTEPLQTGFAHLAVNAVEKSLLIVEALQALDARRGARVTHPALQAAVGRSTNLMISHIAAGEADRLARVPIRCEIGCALSFPPPETLSAVRAEIEAAVAEACARDPWLVEHPPMIEWVSGVTGAETASDGPLYRCAAESITAMTGKAPFVNAMHTASDIRNPINQKGIPTIGLGPLCGDLSQNGGADEWVDVEDYLRAIEVVAAIVLDWSA
jgi:acetylornithine deacetylase